MKCTALFALAALSLAGCTQPYSYNPFSEDKPATITAALADFMVVIDANESTYFARRHIHQVVTASDMMSRTTYETLRDFNNTVASHFEEDVPLNANQVQNMWNEVNQQHLLQNALTWQYSYTSSDAYRSETRIILVKANGVAKQYKQINHWNGPVRDLALQMESVRLPISQDAAAKEPAALPAPEVVQPATQPAATQAEPMQSVQTQPAVTSRPSSPEMVPDTVPAGK